MKEYAINRSVDPIKAICAFVTAVREADEPMWADVEGTRLAVNPKEAKQKDFTDQLIWTWEVLSEDSALLDKKRRNQRRSKTWTNLVPEITREAKPLLDEFNRLNHADLRALVDWMIRFSIVEWCDKWSLTAGQRKSIVVKLKKALDAHGWQEYDPLKPRKPSLERSRDDLVWSAGGNLYDYGHYASSTWVEWARNWLAGKY